MKDTVSHYVPPHSPLTSTEPQVFSNNLTMPSTRRPIHDVEVWELAASLSLLTHHAAVRPGVGVDGMLAAVRREP
jgi:hypothetical protein